MKPKQIHIDGELWKYIVRAEYYLSVWSPRDAKGGGGTEIKIQDIRDLNKFEGRYEYAYTPSAVKAVIECHILKSRKPIKGGGEMICPLCKKLKYGVIDRVDPFNQEINCKMLVIKMCKDCYDDSAAAI